MQATWVTALSGYYISQLRGGAGKPREATFHLLPLPFEVFELDQIRGALFRVLDRTFGATLWRGPGIWGSVTLRKDSRLLLENREQPSEFCRQEEREKQHCETKIALCLQVKNKGTRSPLIFKKKYWASVKIFSVNEVFCKFLGHSLLFRCIFSVGFAFLSRYPASLSSSLLKMFSSFSLPALFLCYPVFVFNLKKSQGTIWLLFSIFRSKQHAIYHKLVNKSKSFLNKRRLGYKSLIFLTKKTHSYCYNMNNFQILKKQF